MPATRKRKPLVLLEFDRLVKKHTPKAVAKVKEVADRATKKAKRATARVEREAYTFAPDTTVAVAIDYKNQRIMVKTVEGEVAPEFLTKISTAAQYEMVVGRMSRGWGLGRDCAHPRSRQAWKNYCIGSDQGVLRFKRAKFCTMCGHILSHVEEGPLKVTLQEIVNMKAAYPQIRKAGQA